MTGETIPVGQAFAKWRADPDYVTAYDALADEFALASALIEARAQADMTQEDVAKAMGTTQAVVARLEGGRSKPQPAPSDALLRLPIPDCASVLSRKASCKWGVKRVNSN